MTFEEQVIESLIDAVVGLELRDLNRSMVHDTVTVAAYHDLRVLEVALAKDHAEELGKLLLQHARRVAHRACLIEPDSHGHRSGVLVGVTRLADVLAGEGRVGTVDLLGVEVVVRLVDARRVCGLGVAERRACVDLGTSGASVGASVPGSRSHCYASLFQPRGISNGTYLRSP